MEMTLQERTEIEEWLRPESKLEKEILSEPEFVRGLMWGKPRFGHPEGKVLYHVREVLDNIDRLPIAAPLRRELRLAAYVHDSFKHLEDKSGYPRDWSKHHAVFARQFLQAYTDDCGLLDLVELHDEAYYSWRHLHLYEQEQKGNERLQSLLDRLGAHRQRYYLFFKCDTRTGDKNQAPLKWFEKTISSIEIVDF